MQAIPSLKGIIEYPFKLITHQDLSEGIRDEFSKKYSDKICLTVDKCGAGSYGLIVDRAVFTDELARSEKCCSSVLRLRNFTIIEGSLEMLPEWILHLELVNCRFQNMTVDLTALKIQVLKFDDCDFGCYTTALRCPETLRKITLRKCHQLSSEDVKIPGSLQVLSLYGCDDTEMSRLRFPEGLKTFKVAKCPWVTEATFQKLPKSVTSVKIWEISALGDDIFKNLPLRLEKLLISRCPLIKHLSFDHLSSLRSLKLIQLENVNDAAIMSIPERVNKMAILEMPHISCESYENLAARSLEKLCISLSNLFYLMNIMKVWQRLDDFSMRLSFANQYSKGLASPVDKIY